MRLLLSGGKATLSAGDSSSEGRRAAMRMFAGLDVGFKRTAVCVVDEAGRIVWRGVVDTHPEALSRALQRWGGKLAKIGLERGSMLLGLCVSLPKWGFPQCAPPDAPPRQTSWSPAATAVEYQTAAVVRAPDCPAHV